MAKGPCLCGDPECPWCGQGQGGPDIGEPAGVCEVCGRSTLDQEDQYVCDACAADIKRIVRDRGE